MKTAIPKPSKQSIIREARDYVMIAIGMILYGIGWTVFLLPNDITTGGVPGIASIVYWATGFPVQYTYFSINFFLLLLALKLLGMKFCIKTIFGVFTLTFFLSVIQKLTAGFGLLHDQPFMACVIGASFCGGGIGVAFSANGSTGGTDIIAPFYVETEIERKDRVLNILNIFKLEKCGLVKGKSANGLNIPKIEWNVVNLLLDNERHRSLDYIDRILK